MNVFSSSAYNYHFFLTNQGKLSFFSMVTETQYAKECNGISQTLVFLFELKQVSPYC